MSIIKTILKNIANSASQWLRPKISKKDELQHFLDKKIKPVDIPKLPSLDIEIPVKNPKEIDISISEIEQPSIVTSPQFGASYEEYSRKFAEIPMAYVYILKKLNTIVPPDILMNFATELENTATRHKARYFSADLSAAAEFIAFHTMNKNKK